MSSNTVTRDLVAVTADEGTHRLLTSPAAVLANVPSLAEAASRDIYIYYWTRDISKARAWLEEAARPTEAELSALSLRPRELDDAMRKLWQAFGRFWQAMSLSPYAFAPFRVACERAWCPMPEADPRYWRGRTVLVNNNVENNSIQCGQWGGSWREYAILRVPREGYSIGQTTFGARQGFAADNIGCRPEGASQIGRCQAPTGETHRLWLQFDGAATGGNLYSVYAVNSDVGGTLGWPSEGQFGAMGNSYWTSDARWARSPVVGQNVYWYIPSWKMYFDLLRAPQRGLRLTADGPDVSIVDYLLHRPPYELAREVLLNVVRRNASMRRKWFLESSDFSATAAKLLDRAEAERLADIRQATTLTHAVAGLVTPFAAAGPVGAAAAIVAGALDLITVAMIPLATKNPNKSIDVFGRMMPAFEVAVTSMDFTAFVALMDEIGLPEGFVNPEIRVRGMPDGAKVKLEGVEIAYAPTTTAPFGQWGDAERSVFVVRNAPAGPHVVTLQFERSTRRMGVDTSNGSVSFDYSRVPDLGLFQFGLVMPTTPSPSSHEPIVTAPPPKRPPPPPPPRTASNTGAIALVAGVVAVGAVLVVALSERSAPRTAPRRNPSGTGFTRPPAAWPRKKVRPSLAQIEMAAEKAAARAIRRARKKARP